MTTKLPPKPFKDFNEQLKIYKSRGLVINDAAYAKRYLQTIGYYRLSGYAYSFRTIIDNKKRGDDFMPNTNFYYLKELYIFDKRLRQLAIDALERIEVAMRTQIVYHLSRYGATAHLQSAHFDDNFNRNKWLSKYYQLIEREQNSDFVKHYESHYTDMPIWVHCELWDFGTMSMLYKGMQQKDKDKIAKYFGLPTHKQLESQLHAFNIIRNISAHYGRLWNRHITKPASLKNMDKMWEKFLVHHTLVYFCLMQMYLKQISPNSHWGERFLALLDDFEKIDHQAVSLKQMGLDMPLETFKALDLWQKVPKKKSVSLSIPQGE